MIATPAGRKRILVADGSSAVIALERMILGADFEVLSARDGMQLLAHAAAQRPDLIVAEADLPGVTGVAACRAIRGRPELRGIPVILVTARGRAECGDTLGESGCTDHVRKPLDALELLAMIRKHLSA